MTKQKVSKVEKVPQVSKAKIGITMADLLAKSTRRLAGFSSGQKIKGKIVSIGSKSVVLDIGGKSEGTVAENAFSEAREFIKTLKVGDEVLSTVIVPETKEGLVLLSFRHAAQDASWGKVEEAKKKGSEVAVIGKGVNPSGITVDVEGLTGFIPTSQLGGEAAKNTSALVGKYFKVKILEVDKLTNKIVLSEKEVSEAASIKKAKEVLEKIKEGEIYEGEVTTVSSFGAFVKIEVEGHRPGGVSGPEGLVHISELSWKKVGHPSEVAKEGDKVKVKVIGKRDGRLALSIKAAGKNPWEDVEKKYKKETKVTGRVTRISDFGAFVELEPGVEGLIHITKIPPATRLTEGQEVDCLVEDLDSKAKKLSLGLVLTSKPIGYK